MRLFEPRARRNQPPNISLLRDSRLSTRPLRFTRSIEHIESLPVDAFRRHEINFEYCSNDTLKLLRLRLAPGPTCQYRKLVYAPIVSCREMLTLFTIAE